MTYKKIFAICKENSFALPAVNVINTDSINAALEAAAKVKSAIVIQFSNGGAAFVAGKGLKAEGQQAAILGAISGAQHVHQMAEAYGVPVILHTDHAAKKTAALDRRIVGCRRKAFCGNRQTFIQLAHAGFV